MKTKKERTYSKFIMNIVVTLYFIGAILGAGLVLLSAWSDYIAERSISIEAFAAYGTYLAGPMSVSIAFYSWKSKAENVLKIANSHKLANTVESVVTAISQMN